MSKVIQQIKISDIKTMYILDFDTETSEITFRDTVQPEILQKEIITMKDETVLTVEYNFHRGYLDKFITENGL